LANKVQFLKYSVDGFREAVEELQLNIDILEEKVDKMYQDVYDTLELQIDDLRGKLNAVLKQLPGAKKVK
jgi:phosphate uptake regulator